MRRVWLRVLGAAACWVVRRDARFGGPSAEKLLGALPVVAGFCSRLKIRDIIDEACPVRDVAGLTHGQVIEALVANRLTSPAPLVHVQAWARDWAVGEALGVEPELLNDDRIGRALDAIAAHLDRIATMSLAGPRKRDPVVRLRRVFVHSSARAQAAASARAKKLDRARDDLARLERSLGTRHYPTIEKVNARIAAISKDRRVGTYLHTETGTAPDTGKPTLTWHFDQAAIDAEAATDGWYALLTNLDPDQADTTQVLTLYKGQEAVERRYAAFKGPLAVAALFLKNNRRIAALVTVICLALLIFCLIERQTRHSLAEQGHTKVEGLYAGRPAIPTGRLILNALATMKIIPGTGQDPPTIPQPTPLQLRLLDLLDTDPRQLR